MAVVKKKQPDTPGKTVAKKNNMGDAPAFVLPTEKSEPRHRFLDYTTLVFGPKKIGKSTLVSLFEDTYFALSEPGAKSLAIWGGDYVHTDWRTVKAARKELAKTKRFKATCWDTVDLMFKMCERYVCMKLGIDHPSEEDWGRGWGAVRDEFTSEVQQWLALGMGMFFISHSTEREIKTRSGMRYDRIQPTMANQARDIVEGLVDIIAYYDYEDDRRVLTIRGNEHLWCGHRLQDHFRTPGGNEVQRIDMGTTPAEGYTNLLLAFDNKYKPAKHAGADDSADVAAVKKTMVVKKRKA